jgi:polar amino acid transport system substrate-binding protein
MRRLFILLSAVFAAGISAITLESDAAADVVRLRADPWCPFNCGPEDAMPGYAVEIAAAALAAAGHEIDYRIMPWARALKDTQQGLVEAALGVSEEEATPLHLILSPLLGLSQACFFVQKGNDWHLTDVKSLKSQTLGVILGYGFGDKRLADYVEANKADQTRIRFVGGDDAVETNLDLLLKGRVSVIVDNADVIRYEILHRELRDKVAEAGCLDSKTRLYIGFSPANSSSAEYAEALRVGLKRMRADGSLKKILDRYGLRDWQ